MNTAHTTDLATAAEQIARMGRKLYDNGWVPATSGNFSMRIGVQDIAITVSGADKGSLSHDDVMQVNLAGQSDSGKKASAELGLHLQLYRRDPAIAAVLHTHSLNATYVSQLVDDYCQFSDLELLKAFSGIDTHESTLQIPVFENSQDINSLSQTIEQHMANEKQGHAYLIRGHGLYTWGASLAECQRHLEALEYLLAHYLMSNGLMRDGDGARET